MKKGNTARTPQRRARNAPPASNRNRKHMPDGAERAVDVEAKAIRWLIENRIPLGMLTLLIGRPKQGKSMFTAWLAAEVSRKIGPVLFSNLEDLRAEVSRPRLEAAGARLDRVHFWTPQLETADGLATLEQFITALKVQLLIIDPIAAHVKASIYNDQQIRQSLTPLGKVLERTGCAAVIVAHARKSIGKNAHPLEVIGGSGGGLAGAARAIYLFGRNPQDADQRVLISAGSNILPDSSAMAFEIDEDEVPLNDGKTTNVPRLLLVDDDVKGISPTAVVASKTDDGEDRGQVKRAIAAEWLTSYLMFGPRPAKEVEEDGKESFSKMTLRRAAEKIGLVKYREAFDPSRHSKAGDRKWIWELPAGHPALKVADAASAALKASGMTITPGELTVEDVLRMIDGGKP